MTTLPERLKELASRMNQDGDKYDAFTLLAEAVQALQAAPEGGEAVGYTAQHSIDLIARGGADGVTFGTYSERYERTVPLYIAPRHPADEGAVDDSMVERAADAYEAAAESEGFGRVEGSERVTHLRFIRAAIAAALAPTP